MSDRVPAAESVRARLLRRAVRDSIKCPGCGRRYRMDHLRFLAHREDSWLYSAVCGRCRSLSFIAIDAPNGQPVVTDVTARELKRFARQAPVGIDDVLDMHETLARFDGDFSALFQPGRDPGRASP